MVSVIISALAWVALCGLAYKLAAKLATKHYHSKTLWWSMLAVTSIPWLPTQWLIGSNAIPQVLLNASLQKLVTPIVTRPQQTITTPDWLTIAGYILIMLYVVGLLVHLARFCLQYWRLNQLCRTASVTHFNNVTVHLLPCNCSGFVFGIIQPKIYAPVAFQRLEKSEQAALVYHELTHIENRDHQALLVWRLLNIIAWFNPFIAKMEHGFIRAMEFQCDKATIAKYRFDAKQYTQALMGFLRRAVTQNHSSMYTPSFASTALKLEDYKQRFQMILTPSPKPSATKLGGLIVLLCSGLTALNLQWTMITGLTHSEWQYPVSSPMISSYFGHVSAFRNNKPHAGIDFPAAVGEPVLAVASGVVTVADNKTLAQGYGNVVLVTHQHGYQSVYAHLDEISVAAGQRIVQGQQLGTVGETGRVTGPHLHLEALYLQQHIDPLILMAK